MRAESSDGCRLGSSKRRDPCVCVQQLSRRNISLKSDSCEEREGVQRRQPAMLVYPALQSPFSFLLEQWPFLNRAIKQLENPS